MLQLELIAGVVLAVVLGFVLFAKGSSKPSPTVADGGNKGAASRGSAPVPPPAHSPTEVGWCMDKHLACVCSCLVLHGTQWAHGAGVLQCCSVVCGLHALEFFVAVAN